jgi:hypothetical protein
MFKRQCHEVFWVKFFIKQLLQLLVRFDMSRKQDCEAGTGTGLNRINLGTPAPEPVPYLVYGSGYEEMKQTTQNNLTM